MEFGTMRQTGVNTLQDLLNALKDVQAAGYPMSETYLNKSFRLLVREERLTDGSTVCNAEFIAND